MSQSTAEAYVLACVLGILLIVAVVVILRTTDKLLTAQLDVESQRTRYETKLRTMQQLVETLKLAHDLHDLVESRPSPAQGSLPTHSYDDPIEKRDSVVVINDALRKTKANEVAAHEASILQGPWF